MEEPFDIRALIGEPEVRVNSKMAELGYTLGKTVPSPYYQHQMLSIWTMYETKIILTIETRIKSCVSVTVAQPEYKEIKKWIEGNTTVIPDAKLNSTAPQGLKNEVREDSHFWYSVRSGISQESGESVYNVNITRK